MLSMERSNVTKYQDLKNDLRNTWELDDIEILPVVIGATGLIKDNFTEGPRIPKRRGNSTASRQRNCDITEKGPKPHRTVKVKQKCLRS